MEGHKWSDSTIGRSTQSYCNNFYLKLFFSGTNGDDSVVVGEGDGGEGRLHVGSVHPFVSQRLYCWRETPTQVVCSEPIHRQQHLKQLDQHINKNKNTEMTYASNKF